MEPPECSSSSSSFSSQTRTARSGSLKDDLKDDLTANLLQSSGSRAILNHSLSPQALASTDSPALRSPQPAVDDNQIARQFRKIGAGQCGTVFSQPNSAYVLKKSNQNTTFWGRWLSNDFRIHVRVHDTLAHLQITACQVPHPFGFYLPESSSFWREQFELFAETKDSLPTFGIVAERIQPLPRRIREALIDCFCPARTQQEARQSEGNRDCLLRIYLGRQRDESRPPNRFFTSRNFGLTLDMMRDTLRLPYETYLESMTEALAAMHWAAKIDARDVEFVLGSVSMMAPAVRPPSTEIDDLPWRREIAAGASFRERIVQVWVLDFNQCNRIDFDDSGLAAMVEAFAINDPYFPRPGRDLWDEFKALYLRYSGKIIQKMDDKPPYGMPEWFLQGLERKLSPVVSTDSQVPSAEGQEGAQGPDQKLMPPT